MGRAAALAALIFAVDAAAECGDCDREHTRCVKDCIEDTKCRRACDAAKKACLVECGDSPEARARKGASARIADLEKECSAGDEKACYRMGELYVRGKEVAQDYPKGARYLEISCRDGHPDACGVLGEMYVRPLGLTQDITRGLGLMEKSCERGSVEGCSAIAQVLYDGVHKKKDFERALKLWREACERQHGPACTALARAHLADKHEVVLALEKFEKACTLGDGHGCAARCQLLVGGEGIPRDEKKAWATCEKACLDGQQDACTEQARLLWVAETIKPNLKKGRDLFDTACEGGDAMACAELGEALELGRFGVKKDPEAAKSNFLRATRRLDKVCGERLDLDACARWATLVARGKVPNKDPVRTRTLLERACTPEEAVGCYALGLLWAQASEPARALEPLTRGCDAEHGGACFELGKLLDATDPAKAKVALEKACARLSAEACFELSKRLKAEKAPAKDVKAAKAKGCRYGLPEACR